MFQFIFPQFFQDQSASAIYYMPQHIWMWKNEWFCNTRNTISTAVGSGLHITNYFEKGGCIESAHILAKGRYFWKGLYIIFYTLTNVVLLTAAHDHSDLSLSQNSFKCFQMPPGILLIIFHNFFHNFFPNFLHKFFRKYTIWPQYVIYKITMRVETSCSNLCVRLHVSLSSGFFMGKITQNKVGWFMWIF